ncbi:lung adenoma susceptibility protein 2-like [Melopsittacus undulatus]|uniref:lung adenoma susceptibility protein 2-like n=1 Tax=Melopsittacus undulatus TaxID=13146 RepID=UPI00146B5AEA|nr:lung adenoma susceptibility protein 2-like [Melopsittacus undulatus]
MRMQGLRCCFSPQSTSRPWNARDYKRWESILQMKIPKGRVTPRWVHEEDSHMDHGWKTWITPASLVSSLLTPWSSCYSQPYSILYREHSYSSALEALEAYIEDFNLSQASPCGSMGKICIHGSIPKEIRLSNHYAKEKQG